MLKGTLPMDTEADGNQEHGFEVLLNGEPDEEQTYRKHHKVADLGVGKSRQFPELAEIVEYKITE